MCSQVCCGMCVRLRHSALAKCQTVQIRPIKIFCPSGNCGISLCLSNTSKLLSQSLRGSQKPSKASQNVRNRGHVNSRWILGFLCSALRYQTLQPQLEYIQGWDGTSFQNISIYFWTILILGNVVFCFNYSQCLRLYLTCGECHLSEVCIGSEYSTSGNPIYPLVIWHRSPLVTTKQSGETLPII